MSCSVHNCNEKVYARGWCRRHYRHVVERGYKEPLIVHDRCLECDVEFDNKIANKLLCRKCYRDKWENDNIEHLREYKARYRADNKERLSYQTKKWKQNNRDKHNKWYREKRKKEPQYRIASSLRSRLWQVLNEVNKSKTTEELLYCTYEQLKEYLEQQFKPGMNLDNYGTEWHIDHVRPLCSFDLTDEEQLKKACHYTNLQPLWAADNLSKSAEDRNKKYNQGDEKYANKAPEKKKKDKSLDVPSRTRGAGQGRQSSNEEVARRRESSM